MLPIDHANENIFLARKARGLGIGKWIGFGGKVEPNESTVDGAVRELREETTIAITADQLFRAGVTYVTFDDCIDVDIEIHVFIMTTDEHFEDHVSLNDEFTPPGQWFHRDHIPYHVCYQYKDVFVSPPVCLQKLLTSICMKLDS